MHTQDTIRILFLSLSHTHIQSHIQKNTELTTDFCHDSEGVSDHVETDTNFSLGAVKHLSNFLKIYYSANVWSKLKRRIYARKVNRG